MLQKFQEHINAKFPFLEGKKLLIAISGGADSVVLTNLLYLSKFDIALAHCNFQLREKESDLDEKFVSELGDQLNLQTFTIKFNTKLFAKKNKLSTQLAARKLRYDWFNEVIEKHHFDYILTAHHADDNLETFLINLTRGTGLEGLTGIPEQNGNIVRPLLVFSRNEILEYAKTNKIEWREDASNSETKYLRNKIRHEIVPKLKEINPSLLSSFEKTSEYLHQNQQIVDDRISDISKEVISYDNEIIKFDVNKIKALSNPKAYLYQLLKDYGFTEWDNIYNLLNAQTGKKITTNSHILLKNREFLLFSSLKGSNEKLDFFTINESQNTVLAPINLSIENALFSKLDGKSSILVDKNLVNFPLILRKWNTGDVFFPTGMIGKKKVSKYFKDNKMSLLQKEKTWILCSNNNEIIWIVGMRQDRRFAATKKSVNIINIST